MRGALLIDTSYFIFHRFFATQRWFALRNKDVDMCDGNVTTNEDFMSAFYRHLENDIKTLKKKYDSDIWLMIDCPRCDIWRMEVYPQYKASRKHASSFDGNIFPLAYDFMESLKGQYITAIISHPRLEADDLCYICQQELRRAGRYEHITLLANDNDYLQLISDNVEVVNKEGKHIKERGCGVPFVDMMKKVLSGDKSDNIPPICRGMGPKTAEKIATMTAEDRDAWIMQKGDHVWQTYLMNRRLIEFSNIPQEYQMEVQENLKQI